MFGEATVRRIYGGLSNGRLASWNGAVRTLGIVACHRPAHVKMKKAADIVLAVEAKDLMYRERFDGFVLAGSDSDFTRLAQRLREGGFAVHGFAESKMPRAFRSACHRYKTVEEAGNGVIGRSLDWYLGAGWGAEQDRSEVAGSETPAEKAGDARKTRGIRFSESEWEDVKRAAQAHGLPAAEFVRERILALARNPESADGPPVGPCLAPLMERMFRYTWFLATERRDAMMREGRAEELDALVEEARAFQDSLRRAHSTTQRPPAAVPCQYMAYRQSS